MQRRVLVRVPDLAAFRMVLADRSTAGGVWATRRRVILVPTRAAGELLRRTIEETALDEGRAIVCPDILTRDDWLDRLHGALGGAPRRLSRIEREIMLAQAARRAAARPRLGGAPFQLRPGIVGAMLDLYDELQRRGRSTRRFAAALFDQLRVERGTDRGTESLIHQTCFLGLTYLAYERAVIAAGTADEHVLRRLVLDRQPELPVDHVVIAVAHAATDPHGLWPADIDLIGRLVRLSRIDVVMTDRIHDAGFRDRIERELPGLVEERPPAAPLPDPIVVRPDGRDELWSSSRDREEEFRGVVRSVVTATRAGQASTVDRVAVVCHRPLPYLYIAQQLCPDAHLPFELLDALPLAAEPYAALLDLVLAVARTGGTRETMVALLEAPHLQFSVDGTPVDRQDASALDLVLAERRSLGGADTYPREVEQWFASRGRAGAARPRAERAAAAADVIARQLAPFRDGSRASDQVGAVADFLRRHERPQGVVGDPRPRSTRARAAVLAVLDAVVGAFRLHDDRPRAAEELVAYLHHALEARTFTPSRGQGGLVVVDAVAARFGTFGEVHVVGLVDADCPTRPRRSVFYTSGLLQPLAWPQETEQARAERAAFLDLLGLPRHRLRLHTFETEGEAPVGVSPWLRESLPVAVAPERMGAAGPVFDDEILTLAADVRGLDPTAEAWLALRQTRPPLDAAAYRGIVEAQSPQAYRVSRVERYVACPFKYFAESVLQLPEERDMPWGLSPLERGTLVHEVFERFYRAWHEQGRGTIDPGSISDALQLFTRLADERLERLPAADRALERTRLLGSILARGLAERVFELEADAGGRIVDRLIEVDFHGAFTFPRQSGLHEVSIAIRGKADRIDVFDDGAIRVVDYKLGRLPDLETSVQVGVYAHCAQQRLEAEGRRPHPIRAAMYLAFGDERRLEGRLGRAREPVNLHVSRCASDFAGAVQHIEDGQFPARPLRPSECGWCGYAGVCRKEYAAGSEDDDAADAV